MAQICVDNAQIRDGMGVQSVTLGRGRAHPLAWRCSCRLKGRLLGGCGRLGRLGRLGIQHSQEEEEAARLGEHRACEASALESVL